MYSQRLCLWILQVRDTRTHAYTNTLHYRAAEESHGREYVVLDAEVTRVNDPKRSFAFSLSCKGVEEMFLAAEDDHLYEAWIARLTNAARSDGKPTPLTPHTPSHDHTITGEYSDAWNSWQSEESLAGSKVRKI